MRWLLIGRRQSSTERSFSNRQTNSTGSRGVTTTDVRNERAVTRGADGWGEPARTSVCGFKTVDTNWCRHVL